MSPLSRRLSLEAASILPRSCGQHLGIGLNLGLERPAHFLWICWLLAAASFHSEMTDRHRDVGYEQ